MKKALLIIVVLVFQINNLQASHVGGGEITWQCLNDGRYIFYMNFYRDCTGINQVYSQQQFIQISGNPLPSGGLDSITLNADSSQWINNSFGQIPNNCNPQYTNQLSCRNGDAGLLEFYSYKSDTISLTGVPPSSGWKFDYLTNCCYPVKENTNSIFRLNFQSIMYPNVNGDSVNTCFDSSPYFAELPSYTFCRGQYSTVNHNAIDADGDSLSYDQVRSFGISSSGSATALVPLSYKAGYSQVNPTPNQSFSSTNLPYSLDKETGDISFKVYNGSGVRQFTTNTLITAWRDGVRIASISRAIPITVFDCDTITGGQPNNPPYVDAPFPNNTTNPYHGVVTAGNNINLSIVIRDSNSFFFSTNPQSFKIMPKGGSLSNDLMDSRNCPNPSDTSCATFSFAPSVDSSAFPPINYYLAYGAAYMNLNWNTDCNHLNPDGTAKTHYFLIKGIDDHCPVPAMVYKTISITVIPPLGGCNLTTEVGERNDYLKEHVQVYPNPTNGVFYLSGLSLDEKYNIEIRNIQGALLQRYETGNQSNLELNIEGKPGIYFIQLTNEKGERANMKVVKQ